MKRSEINETKLFRNLWSIKRYRLYNIYGGGKRNKKKA